MNELILMGGMPRAGSELLINLLAQNPDIFPGKPSGLLPTLVAIRNSWDELVEHRAIPVGESDARKLSTLRGVVDSYWDVPEPYVIDSSRGWIHYLELIENVMQRKVKVIVPVRDLREILASCEKLWQKNAAIVQIPQEKIRDGDMQHVTHRCDVWMDKSQFVGIAYDRIADVIGRGYMDRLHFVQFERLTADPIGTLAGIYEFLDIPYFEHDPQNVVKVTVEDDRVHGFRGLHEIRSEIVPVPPKRHIIGDAAIKYKGPYVWDVQPTNGQVVKRRNTKEHNPAK